MSEHDELRKLVEKWEKAIKDADGVWGCEDRMLMDIKALLSRFPDPPATGEPVAWLGAVEQGHGHWHLEIAEPGAINAFPVYKHLPVLATEELVCDACGEIGSTFKGAECTACHEGFMRAPSPSSEQLREAIEKARNYLRYDPGHKWIYALEILDTALTRPLPNIMGALDAVHGGMGSGIAHIESKLPALATEPPAGKRYVCQGCGLRGIDIAALLFGPRVLHWDGQKYCGPVVVEEKEGKK